LRAAEIAGRLLLTAGVALFLFFFFPFVLMKVLPFSVAFTAASVLSVVVAMLLAFKLLEGQSWVKMAAGLAVLAIPLLATRYSSMGTSLAFSSLALAGAGTLGPLGAAVSAAVSLGAGYAVASEAGAAEVGGGGFVVPLALLASCGILLTLVLVGRVVK
jgi:hypothetical protein